MSSFFPGNIFTNGQNILSQTLGILLKPINWEPDADIDRVIENVVSDGEVTGMYRLAAATGIRRALIGVSYIDNLRRDDGPVIEFEKPCPEWNDITARSRFNFHQGSKKVYLSQ